MNVSALIQAGPVIQMHMAAALVAAAFGLAVLVKPKGTATHRILGWGFAGFMLATAISSFWITAIRPGHFSAIHILSAITLVSIPLALYYRRTGNIHGHARAMIAPLAGLLIAGAATLFPGRVLYSVFFG